MNKFFPRWLRDDITRGIFIVVIVGVFFLLKWLLG